MDDLHIIEPRRVNILEPKLSTIVDFVSKSKSAFLLTSFLGAENETRTRDPNLGKVMLYQLSYFRILLPVLVVWDCKGTHFFFTSKLFCKIFQKNVKKCDFSLFLGLIERFLLSL